MNSSSIAANPFTLMLEPERVLQAMESSESLRKLRHRKMHPLDKPLIPLRTIEQAQLAAQIAAENAAQEKAMPANRLDVKSAQRQLVGFIN